MRLLPVCIRSAVIAVSVPASLAASSVLAEPSPAPAEAPFVLVRPFALVDTPESIYPDPEPPQPNTGINEGGVHLSLNVNYMTDYVYRGIDRSEVGAIDPSETGDVTEDAPNLQFDGKLTFDLGRIPHPFIGAFVNVYNDDPVSRFQEVRPYFGLDWNIRPLRLTAGWQTYIHPERDDFNTSEIFGQIVLDDSVLFRTEAPLLSPYVFGAYDHDLYDGLYLEAGLRHDFVIDGTNLTLTAVGSVAFVASHEYFSTDGTEDTGLQHYQVGLIGTYKLNTLLNLSRRYGEWTLRGFLYYTDGIDNKLRADTQIWAGVGIGFDY